MKFKLIQGHKISRVCSTLFTIPVCFFLLGASVEVAASDQQERLSEVLVNTKNGPVQGIIKKSRSESVEFVSFLGLRYASQPARFEASKPLEETWKSHKIANIPGNPCPQIEMTGNLHQNEDCLFLNVHVPKSHLEDDTGTLKPLPVMVWIHGGAFVFGEGHSYGAEYFMETENVILVTINYRLGALGFISMGNEDDAFTSNNGLRDCVMALKWVQENIAAFKGNPGKVTIFGESAGSASVHYLLMSPLAKGLFHGAIMESGAFCFWSYAQSPWKDAIRFATFLGCPGNQEPKQVRKCLEGKSVKELLAGQSAFNPIWPPNSPLSRFLPTAKEPKANPFFSGEPSSFFTFHEGSTKYASKVPVMVGINREEGSITAALIRAQDTWLSELNVNWDHLAPKAFSYDVYFPDDKSAWISKRVRDFYFGNAAIDNDSIQKLVALYSDVQFLLPVMEAAGDMAKDGISVWPFVFSYLGKWSIPDALQLPKIPDSVGHADELQYLFPHSLFGPPLESGSDSEKFSKRFVKLWTSFAQNGEPHQEWVEGKPLNWEPISAVKSESKERSVPKINPLRIDGNPKMMKTFEFRDRLEFWRKTLKEAMSEQPNSDKKTKQEL